MKRSAASRAATLPAHLSLRARLAIAAGVLALVAIPHFAQAQGIVGGARDGSREGYRAAGPVGGFVGGAIGAGVGGAVGGVKGVLGIPDQGYNPNGAPAYRTGYKPRRHYHRNHHRRYR
jgi:hypothetical protein